MAHHQRVLWHFVYDPDFYNRVLAHASAVRYRGHRLLYRHGTLLDEGGRTRVKDFFAGLFQRKNNG